ncbi:MAG: carboxypeptidase-like regulatory domain-containing protein, partial [Bacteroidetes bacterium]|nr:carboxypeptidase-like regulatory domain-containing protein [Bacteroidota bacterium]
MRKFLHLFVALLLMLLLLPPSLMAQEKTITGTVTSEDGSTALRGVTVSVKGTKRYTLTDEKGAFSIQATPNETLLLTYVGYEPTEVKVGQDNTLNITLKQS